MSDDVATTWVRHALNFAEKFKPNDTCDCTTCLLARALLTYDAELKRWRGLGKDLVHGTMLAALSKTEQSLKAERDALQKSMDDVLVRAAEDANEQAAQRAALANERDKFKTALQGTLAILVAVTKHGPNGRGGPGPCDAYCYKCRAEAEFVALGES